MRKYILIYRHLIVLLWELLILIIFKVTTNFKFTNFVSLLFVSLIVIFPLIIYIWSYLRIRKIRIKHQIKVKGYFEGIKRDEIKNILNNELINLINQLGYNTDVEVYDDKILILVKNINQVLMLIEFNKYRAKLTVLNTLVIYRFYYSYVNKEFTKYDLRNFEYKNTSVLYTNIYKQIYQLANHKYIYLQKHSLIKLTRIDIMQDIYVRKVPPFLYPKVKKEKIEIEL